MGRARDVAGVDQPVGVGAAGGGDAQGRRPRVRPAKRPRRGVVRGVPRVRQGAAQGPGDRAVDGGGLGPERRLARNRGDDADCEGVESGERAAGGVSKHRRGDAGGGVAVGGAARVRVRDEKRTCADDGHADERCPGALPIARKTLHAGGTGADGSESAGDRRV